MVRNSVFLTLSFACCLIGCTQDEAVDSSPRPGIRWVQTAAEYQALSRQAYNAATASLDDAIADTSWSALPQQTNAADLPVAIIFDVDETLVSNADFQAILESPFRSKMLDDWNSSNVAVPVPGAPEFAIAARASGAELFFVSNRSCEAIAGVDHPCPQEAITIQDLTESGVPADSEHVMLAYERAEWTKEKLIRRNLIAKTHRVIMLVGDDLGDFIACSRRSRLDPCETDATIASRAAATEEYKDYWGAKWIVLPNPMHGSWMSVM